MKRHPSIATWSADEISECLEGVSRELSTRLWRLVKDRPFTEEPVVRREGFWYKLSEEDQREINRLAEKEFGNVEVPTAEEIAQAKQDMDYDKSRHRCS